VKSELNAQSCAFLEPRVHKSALSSRLSLDVASIVRDYEEMLLFCFVDSVDVKISCFHSSMPSGEMLMLIVSSEVFLI
jgi:hypothetical protein